MALEIGPFVVGRPKIGLALGSGASRGWAHIGVIKALTEAGVPIDLVAGTSAGAVVGAYYAAGALDDLRRWADTYTSSLRTLSFLDISLGKGGLIEGKRFIETVSEHLPVRTFEDLQKPFGCVATDLTNMQEVHLTAGALLPALRSSVAIPGFLSPLRHKDIMLVDGGLLNSVPVNLARSMGADVVIAVDLNTHAPTEEIEGVTKVLNRTIETMMNRIRLVNREYHPADFYIEPDVTDFALMDFHRSHEATEAGYREAKVRLPELERTLKSVFSYAGRRLFMRVPSFASVMSSIRLSRDAEVAEPSGSNGEQAAEQSRSGGK